MTYKWGCNTPGHRHQGYPVVRIRMLGLCAWPVRVQVVNIRVCGHPEHIHILDVLLTNSKRKPAGRAWSWMCSGARRWRTATPLYGLNNDQVQVIIDGLRWVGGGRSEPEPNREELG